MRKAPRAAVLVVEDGASVRSSLDRSLRRAGYDVHLADSSDGAFQVIDVTCPDIVLLDVMMPGGANGYEVCRAFRDREDMELVPVIFVTALDTEQNEAKAFSEKNSVVPILGVDGGMACCILMMSMVLATGFYLERGSTFDRQPHRPSTGAALLAHPAIQQCSARPELRV